MTVARAAEQLYCTKCSDPVESVDDDGYGRCCHNLPHPWHRGSDGLYTHTSGSADAEEEDIDENDVRPRCPYCGGRGFRIDATVWRRHLTSHSADSEDNETDDATLWYDRDDFETTETDDPEDFSIRSISCTRCDRDVSNHVNAEDVNAEE
jgi:DNA-directed RNA polymerase subunit RPC12/RpoP